MKIEFDVDDKTVISLAHDAIRSKLGPKGTVPHLLSVEIDKQLAEVVAGMDLRQTIRARIDEVTKEIVADAVNNRLRGIARTIVNQEIERARATATLEATA